MTDFARHRTEIVSEMTELCRLQIKAVKDATFLGWELVETTAYAERRSRIEVLRRQLADLDTGSLSECG